MKVPENKIRIKYVLVLVFKAAAELMAQNEVVEELLGRVISRPCVRVPAQAKPPYVSSSDESLESRGRMKKRETKAGWTP